MEKVSSKLLIASLLVLVLCMWASEVPGAEACVRDKDCVPTTCDGGTRCVQGKCECKDFGEAAPGDESLRGMEACHIRCPPGCTPTNCCTCACG